MATLCSRNHVLLRWISSKLVVRSVLLVMVLTLIQYYWLSYPSFLLTTNNNNAQRGQRHARPHAKDTVAALTRSFFPEIKSDMEQQHQAEDKYSQVFSSNHTVTLADLADLHFDDSDQPIDDSTIPWEEAAASRQPILDLLSRAGVSVDLSVLQRLPTWQQVIDLYGATPVVLGTERCAAFRAAIPADQRFVGVAGQMNTGTNALAKYLQHNIRIEANEIGKGVLWTVPWFKHGWASLQHRYEYRLPSNHSLVMAVVLVKDPYFWMKSMCESPYSLEWHKSKRHCPTLTASNDTSVEVKIRWATFVRRWPSLAHVWSSWNREYVESDIPRLMVRYEDLLLRPQFVVDTIRDCVGAEWKDPDQFVWQAAPAKTHPYFAKFKAPSSLVSALIKYGKDSPLRMGTMNLQDVVYAKKYLDAELMEMFHYRALSEE